MKIHNIEHSYPHLNVTMFVDIKNTTLWVTVRVLVPPTGSNITRACFAHVVQLIRANSRLACAHVCGCVGVWVCVDMFRGQMWSSEVLDVVLLPLVSLYLHFDGICFHGWRLYPRKKGLFLVSKLAHTGTHTHKFDTPNRWLYTVLHQNGVRNPRVWFYIRAMYKKQLHAVPRRDAAVS